MRKMLYVAGREFTTTVMTRGFILGMLLTPALLGLVIFIMPRMMNRAAPKIEGQVAIIDPTGVVKDALSSYLSPEKFAERRAKTRDEIERQAPAELRQRAPAGADAAMRQSVETALGEVPRLAVTELPAGTDIEQAKAPLKTALPKRGGDPNARLVLVVVHQDAVRRDAGNDSYGTYDLYERGKIDGRLVDDIHSGLRDAIVSARLKESGLNPADIRNLTTVKRPDSLTVTAEGERTTNTVLNMLLPAGFMLLLMMSVMTSGGYLLMTTVEEKSNRVVEVLLSAVSAMELMTGKIIGQMAVGLVVLALYAGLGLLALISFASIGLLDPVLILYLVVFYFLAAFTYAAMMAAIGSAVNEMSEAQSLMMPAMMVVMVPWVLWLPISREPNAMLAVVLSFVPPFSNFVMLLRMTSNSPPPFWQTSLSIAVGAAGVYAALWFAAKVFRVGLLMYGKPPTFGTLVRWARMS